MFGEAWGRWIAEAAESRGCPVDYVALPLLSIAGGLLANVRRGSPWSGWIEPPVVWTALVGNPSSGKSPGLYAITDVLRALEAELDSDFAERRHDHVVVGEIAKAKRQRWEAEVAHAVKNGMAPPEPGREIEAPAPPSRRRLLTSDTTVEKLARLVSANPRGFVLARDELAGWLGSLDRYSGGGADRAFFLEAFGGRSFVVDRVKDVDAIRIPYLSVAITGGIQPDRLASMLLDGDDDGLTARFCFGWPEPLRPVRPKRGSDDVAALGRLRWLIAVAQDQEGEIAVPRVLPFEPAAADAIQGWREQVADLEATAHGLFLSWIGKLAGLAVRLATVLEFLHWSGSASFGDREPVKVSARATDAALALIESYFLPMARRTFADAAWPEKERDALALGKWITTRDPVPDCVNARDIRRQSVLATREAARVDAALAELEAAGFVRTAERGSGAGRRRKDWDVNPVLRGSP